MGARDERCVHWNVLIGRRSSGLKEGDIYTHLTKPGGAKEGTFNEFIVLSFFGCM